MENIKISIDENRNFTCEGEEKAVSSFLKNNNIDLNNFVNPESKKSFKLNRFTLLLLIFGLLFVIFNVIFLVYDLEKTGCEVLTLLTVISIIIIAAMVQHKWKYSWMTLIVGVGTSLILAVSSGYLTVPKKIGLTEPEIKGAIEKQINPKN